MKVSIGFLFFTISFLISNNAFGISSCSYPASGIFDLTTTSSTIVFSGTTGIITDINISVGITHPYIDDLTIRVVSPAGTTVYLYDRGCSSEDNLQTSFDDEGSGLICPPINNVLTIPVNSLSAFDGQSLNGTWTLYVYDNANIDEGTLNNWCIQAALIASQGEQCISSQAAINDNSTTSSSITISGRPNAITDMNVKVNLTHTFIGDLIISLVSPIGTSVTLFNRSCSTSDNIQTIFDDEGSVLICPPVGGVITIPSSALSAFDGQIFNGTWTLRVQDNATTDVGTLIEWCLIPTLEPSCLNSQRPQAAISDIQTTSSQITFSGTNGLITDINVFVDITHTFIGDLNIWLISPAGTNVSLFNRSCGTNEIILTYFDDEGNALVCPPAGGVYTIPDVSLAAFDGQSLNGTWTLFVQDNASIDEGTFHEWCLLPTLGECGNNAQCNDNNPCTNDICSNAICSHNCSLGISNIVFTANSIQGCNDGTVSANVSFSSCNNSWNAYLYDGPTTVRSWSSSQGASVSWNNIPAGNYLMVASSSIDCSASTNINISSGLPCSIQMDTTASTPTSVQGCNDGSINAIINAFVCEGQWSAVLKDQFDDVVRSWSFAEGSAILWDQLPSGNYSILAADNGICAIEVNVTIPSGSPCHVGIQNVQKTVVDCGDNSITADISALTCNNSWFAYLYIGDYSSFIKSTNNSLSSSIIWNDIPLGEYHLFATDFVNCSDTVDIILTCSDNDPCTIDNCNGGCSHTFKCEDNNPCTEDFCQGNGQCLNQPIICNDNNQCTTDACINGNCISTPINCVDNNPCTSDQCINGNCIHTTIICNDGNACTNDFCQGGNCIYQPLCILDDGNPCTDDHCVNRTCLHPPKNCADNSSCTTDLCQAGQCTHTPVCALDDNNPCTIDQCQSGSCFHQDTCSIAPCTISATCDDADLCTSDTCINGGCSYIPKACDDGISCTNDRCDSLSGNCLFVSTCTIDDQDPCTNDGCINGACLHAPKECDDHNTCTSDLCQNGNCIFQPLCVLDDLDLCTRDFCLSSQCFHQDTLCNDGFLCTNDDCQGGVCIYEPLDCDDGNGCTNDSCFNGNCISTIIPNCDDPCDTMSCSDNDLCTNDSCSNETCVFTALSCDDNDPCTTDSCDGGICGHAQMGNCNLAISGAIVSELGIPIPNVTVSLTGTGNLNLTTANDGLFNFNVTQGDNCTITPSKSNDSITNNGVSTLDIILVQRQILSVQPLNSHYKKIAADVNNSQSVSTLDVVLIRSVILQTNRTFPNGKLWAFVKSDFVFYDSLPPFPYDNFRTYPNISSNKTNQDFIGIKLGDVNGTWNPNIPKQGTVGEVQFIMNDYTAMPGDEIIVPVKVKDFNKITGYQFTLSWNSEVLQLLEVESKSLNGFFGMNYIGEGRLTTSWFDEMTKAISLDNGEDVFDLKFKVTGAVGSYSGITISSELTWSEAYNENFDLLNIVPVNGIVKVGSFITHPSSMYNLRVQPNPFANSTNIIFTIPQDETVSIIIYDLLGKEVKHILGQFKAGQYSIEWTGDDDAGKSLSSGLYHVRMMAGETLGLKILLAR